MPRIPATEARPKPTRTPPDETPIVQPVASPPPAADPVRPVEVVQLQIETIRVEVPLGMPGPGYRSSHVEAKLKPPQAETMQRLVVALRDRRAVTLEGREVRTPADAVRWLLDRIAAA